MAMWNPWRGCHRCSEGCKYCYIHKGDAKRNVDTDRVVKTNGFDAPVAKNQKGEYRIKDGQTVYLCFSTDFLIEDADSWRNACWEMIKERPDLNFIFLTKRIHRFMDCIPADWGEGYANVTVGCTVENQRRADERLSLFSKLPIKHKNIICQPLIGKIDLAGYLIDTELVVVGGESDRYARPLDYDWVLSIREQCIREGIHFQFRQCGTHFIKDGKMYTLKKGFLSAQAQKANIDY
jgi:protein gp37